MHLIEFWNKDTIPLEEGSILKYIASEYDIRNPGYKYCFQVIGDPVTGDNSGVTHYTFATSGSEYKTHIKTV